MSEAYFDATQVLVDLGRVLGDRPPVSEADEGVLVELVLELAGVEVDVVCRPAASVFLLFLALDDLVLQLGLRSFLLAEEHLEEVHSVKVSVKEN